LSSSDVVTEPLSGWRAWQIVATRRGPALASWSVSALWPARRPLEARCALHGPRPSAHHMCGIHAFQAREEMLAYLESGEDAPLLFSRRPQRALGIAVGRVSGWGRAVIHARGWRAQFAYPYDLYLLRGDRALSLALSSRYAVETLPAT
jgi:hypothetical protein